MGSLKLGLYALTLELAAWGGGLRLASEASDQALAWYLLVHLFASFLLSACAALLLPVGSRRQRGLFLFMMTGFAYGIPVAGFIGIAIGILWLRLYRTPNAPPIFASLQLPDFDPHQRRLNQQPWRHSCCLHLHIRLGERCTDARHVRPIELTH